MSTFAESQGLKAAAKRTPFGDVSNIAAGRPSKDDSNLQTKGTLKPSQVLDQRRSLALLRPAQKGIKSILAGAAAAATSKPVLPPSTIDNGISSLPLKKTLTKRHTTIFKDNRLSVVPETEVPPPKTANTREPEDGKVANIDHRPDNFSTLLLSPPEPLPPSEDPVKELQEILSDNSLPGIEEVSLGPSVTSETNKDVEVKDTTVTVSENISRPIAQYPFAQPLPLTLHASDGPHDTALPMVGQPMAVSTLINPVENIPPLSPHHLYIQQTIDQEEYWDEEDDENYDETGYVTARSFRSRGDNTTSGATMVLFPQMNQRVRKEIAASKQLVEATRSPEEVEDETYDTSMVAEYGDEIFEYMKQLEVKMLPNAHYMENQHEIQWSMRSVLMDWLVQVHLRFNLLPETLYLTVNYIDRFLSCKVVSLGKLQLVGATAIFIAAKYEEINCPSVQEIVYMVDGGYSVDEVLKAERFMLTMLQFELGWPGPMSFLRRISKADDYDLETRTLAKYFLEVTLMDERFIGSPPSFAAAAAHCLARVMLRKGTWVR